MGKPPSKGNFWRAFAAVTILPINGSQKAVLGCLIDHANPNNGLCYPSEALIAAEIAHSIRTVERAIADLLRKLSGNRGLDWDLEVAHGEFDVSHRNKAAAQLRGGSGPPKIRGMSTMHKPHAANANAA